MLKIIYINLMFIFAYKLIKALFDHYLLIIELELNYFKIFVYNFILILIYFAFLANINKNLLHKLTFCILSFVYSFLKLLYLLILFKNIFIFLKKI